MRMLILSYVVLLVSLVRDAAGLTGCETGVDMVFVVDTSRSMTRAEFDLQMEFVLEMASDFKIGRQDTQVAVVQYAHVIYKLFCFDEYLDNISVMKAISRRHRYFRGSTKTSKAFKYLRKRIFHPRCGMREHSTKIVILLTDGMPNEPSKAIKEAKLLMDTGVTVVTIGIGNELDRPTLLALASSPEVAFNTTNFFDLEIIRPNVAMESCKKINPDLASLMTQCEVGLDILFLVDHSRSLDHHEHELQMDFVETMSRNFLVTDSHFHTRVSMAMFAHTIFDSFCFHEFLSNVELSLAINHTREFPEGSTNIAKALRFARTKLFSENCGSRPDAFKVAVLITDAKANEPLDAFYEASLLKQQGVKIVTVGVGEIDERMLHPLASNHDMTFDNVHEVSIEKITAHTSSGACEIALNHNHTWSHEDIKFIHAHAMKSASAHLRNHEHSHHHRHAMLHSVVDLGEKQYEFSNIYRPLD